MPNPKKTKGIAIKLIKEAMARGEKFVTGVSMSEVWYKDRDETVKKLLSGKYGNKVEFVGASKSFYATFTKPEDSENIIDKIKSGDLLIYIGVDGKHLI